MWAHNVWRKITEIKGGEEEIIKKYFAMLPILESHIDNLVDMKIFNSQREISKQSRETFLQDYYVSVNIDTWRVPTTTQKPSLLHQMCTAAKRYRDILASNYYFPLAIGQEEEKDSHETMMNQVSTTNTTADTPINEEGTQNSYQVDLIDLETLESLIEEQRKNDLEVDDEIQTQNEEINKANGTVFVHRIELTRMLRMKTPEKIGESFKNFYISFKRADPHAVIRPFYKNDAYRIPSINDSTQVQKPDMLDVSRYHQGFRPNQRFSLTGKMVLETKLTFDELKSKLEPWLQKNYYEISLSECQTEELVTIGILNHSSFTLNRNDLTKSLKAMIRAQTKELQFEFSIRLDQWFCNAGVNGGVPMLFVSVERSKIQEGTAFFCKLYNGENTRVPDGHKLWFIPTYQIDIPDEVRERIGQEQRSWRSAEVACYIYGLQDISNSVKLKSGLQTTIRNLLLSFPNGDPASSRRTLFHGVDRDSRKNEWIFVKYHTDDSDLFQRRARRLAYDLAQLVEVEDLPRLFLNPELGLEFGGEITKTYSAHSKKSKQPNPVNPRILQHYNSMVGKLQNVATKRPVAAPHETRRHENEHQTYASSAARAMYTSTTHTRDVSTADNPNATRTTTESVVVIQQYEQRFVQIENMCQENTTRINRMEVTTSTTANMIKRLLIHSGIPLDAEVDDDTAATSMLTSPSGSGRMDIDHEGASEGGTKRQCQSQHTQHSSSGTSTSNRY